MVAQKSLTATYSHAVKYGEPIPESLTYQGFVLGHNENNSGVAIELKLDTINKNANT